MIFVQEQNLQFWHKWHQNYYTGQTKQAEFFQHWNKQATNLPQSAFSHGQNQIKNPTLTVATNQMSDHT